MKRVGDVPVDTRTARYYVHYLVSQFNVPVYTLTHVHKIVNNMKIGLIPMAARPYHLGHDGLIRLAAKECDQVIVFASMSDRVRTGETGISGAAMTNIWKTQIEPSLPDNVSVTYGGSPTRNVYEYLISAEEANSLDTFAVYGDPTDVTTNFSMANVARYVPNLVNNDHFAQRPVERASTIDISGTKMRAYLTNGDKESFIRHLPQTIDGEAVWNALNASKIVKTPKRKGKRSVGESLIHEFVKMLIS